MNVIVFPVLIETLWNVNHIAEFLFHINCGVLIETLWNVNYIHGNNTHPPHSVLIETLWNVNRSGRHSSDQR